MPVWSRPPQDCPASGWTSRLLCGCCRSSGNIETSENDPKTDLEVLGQDSTYHLSNAKSSTTGPPSHNETHVIVHHIRHFIFFHCHAGSAETHDLFLNSMALATVTPSWWAFKWKEEEQTAKLETWALCLICTPFHPFTFEVLNTTLHFNRISHEYCPRNGENGNQRKRRKRHHTRSALRSSALVTFGAPKLCSMRTLRPLGPKVTATASARRSAPGDSCLAAYFEIFPAI